MTEVVTSYAASPQLSLLAPRQQVFGASEAESQPARTLPSADASALHSVLAAADKTDGRPFASDAAPREGGGGSGPSRPRVEVKRFDVGLSPSEVVGTPDVLQRFDRNGDGRVDIFESVKSVQVRQQVFTFASLAAAPRATTADEAGRSSPALTEAQAPALARETGAALAALGGDTVGLPRKFAGAAEGGPDAGPDTRKFHDTAAALAGAPGVSDVPKKYYGQGVEVVAGQAAADGAPVKYADRAPARENVFAEDGAREVKYYDRVPQAESGGAAAGDGGAAGGETYAEKAREIAAALRGGGRSAAAYAQAETPAAAPIATVVTA